MDWNAIFIHDTTWAFASEILLRCLIMYVLIIVFLRLTGKRGIRQLSIFEVAILLALGSIAGDPMFDEELPIIQAVLVMSSIVLLYRLNTWLMMKYQPFEDLIEGRSLYIVQDGMLVLDKIQQGKMSHDEFFAEMRQQNIEHLGQVRVALLETNGNLSVLFYADEQVKYGLPLFPHAQQQVHSTLPDVQYACLHCGFVSQLSDAKSHCPRCQKQRWTQAFNSTRLS